MLSQNKNLPIISSNKLSNITSLNEKNTKITYNNSANKKLSPNENIINNNNKMKESSQKEFTINNSLVHKRIDSPFVLKDQKIKELTPTDNIKIVMKTQKEKNTQQYLFKNKLVEKYKIYIQQLQNYLIIKEEEIKALKIELQKKT